MDFAEGDNYPGGAAESRHWDLAENDMVEIGFPIHLVLGYRRMQNEESHDGRRSESTVAMKRKAAGCQPAVVSFGDSLRAGRDWGKVGPYCSCAVG